MDFVDATILRLADESLRDSVFDGEALAQLLAASHDITGLAVDAPFTAVFDEVSLAYDDEPGVNMSGAWLTVGHTERTEIALQASGIGAVLPRIDLLISGAVVATAAGGAGRVQAVDVEWLESEPHSADAALNVTFADAAEEAARRRNFPFAAALLVRDTPLSLATLLDETRRLRAHLHRLGFGAAAAAASPRARRSPIIAWVVPAAVFDDEGWPGADTGTPAQKRAQRRQRAGAWLARERIGLVVPPT